MTERKRRPEAIGKIVASVIDRSGIGQRIEQAGIIPEWRQLVGPQIAAVTSPQSISANGTLFVRVTTNAWANELSMLEPELLKSLNRKPERAPVKKIRWMLGQP